MCMILRQQFCSGHILQLKDLHDTYTLIQNHRFLVVVLNGGEAGFSKKDVNCIYFIVGI
jgi:hypothetical protein